MGAVAHGVLGVLAVLLVASSAHSAAPAAAPGSVAKGAATLKGARMAAEATTRAVLSLALTTTGDTADADISGRKFSLLQKIKGFIGLGPKETPGPDETGDDPKPAVEEPGWVKVGPDSTPAQLVDDSNRKWVKVGTGSK